MKKKTWKQSSTYQVLFGDSIVPGCVPFYYRINLLWRKLTRSVKGRKSKNKFINPSKQEIFNESDRLLSFGDRKTPIINKTFLNLKSDLGDYDVKPIVSELRALQDFLTSKGLRFTSAGGSFKSKDYVPNKELNKMWENAWVLACARPRPGEIILDLGGASTIFSFYLASKGCRVYCVDNDWGCHGIIYNTRAVAKK